MTLSKKNHPSRIPVQDFEHIALRLSADLRNFSGKRLFITGATGFFGKWILNSLIECQKLLSLNFEIIAVSRDPQKFLLENPWLNVKQIQWIKGDVEDFSIPSHERFSYVIHAATPTHAGFYQSKPELMLHHMTRGAKHVLDQIAGRGVEKALFISSGGLYGRIPPECSHVSEDYLFAPDPLSIGSVYGEGKRMGELLFSLRSRTDGFEWSSARCFAFSGPYLPLDEHFAIGNFVANVLRHQKIHIGGDGTPMRSYLDAADLVVWLLKILMKGQNNHAYNVGSDQQISILDLAKTVSDVAGRSYSEIHVSKQPTLGKLPETYVPSVLKAKTELGLNVDISLKNSISRMIEFNQL